MVQCCMCVSGKCSKDCPTLDVLPYDETREGIIRKAQKLQASGMKIKDIKAKLKAAGGAEAKNRLINKWIQEYDDSRRRGPLHEVLKNRAMIIKKQQLINEIRTVTKEKQKVLETVKYVTKEARAFYENIKADSTIVADADKGILDGPSSKD